MADQGNIKCRKWTLFSFTVVAIIIQIVVIILAINVINDLERPSGTKQDEWDAAKVN